MRVTIRLYKRYDIDLLSLYHNSEFKFKESFKSAVRNYIRGTPQKIQIPEPQDDTFSYETIQFQLNFHPKEDQDVIMWIRNIKAGYKNSILKNMFRNSLCGIYYYYTMNVHRADEMLILNHKSAEAAANDDKKDQDIIVDDKKENKIQEVNKEEQEKREVNDRLDDEAKNSEDDHSEEIKEEYKDKTSNSNIKGKITIPISNTKDQETKVNEPEEIDEIQKEPEFTEPQDNEISNETVDIDDSYDEDENDSIFAIAGKMMQGF